jgi:hypothetical protein
MKRGVKSMLKFKGALGIALIFLISACNVYFGDIIINFSDTENEESDTVSGDEAEEVVRNLFTFLYTGEGDLDRIICDGATGEALQQGLEQTAEALTDSGAEISVSGLTFTASDVTDTTATVTVGGSISVTLAGQTVDIPFSDVPISLTQTDGAWQICG